MKLSETSLKTHYFEKKKKLKRVCRAFFAKTIPYLVTSLILCIVKTCGPTSSSQTMVLCTQCLCTDKTELFFWGPFHPNCNAKSATKTAAKFLLAQNDAHKVL